MSKWELFSLMGLQGTANIKLPDGRVGILLGFDRESGSGRSFNLRILVDGRTVNVFLKTSD